MKKIFVFGVLALLIIGGSVLHAQNNATLDSGVYQLSGYSAEVVLTNRGIVIWRQDGGIVKKGRWEIVGDRINVRWDDRLFEAWLVSKNDTFIDTEGNAWFRVRNVRDADLR
ncbi:MAG: hypothetical protein LBH20_07635 [Treponema sp.]|jgi:hypothetical protein|nr:hypothetical protein [Treponema sp.]